MLLVEADTGLISYTIDPATCRVCGTEPDAHTVTFNEAFPPQADDFSVCPRCGDLTVFTGDGVIRREATSGDHAQADNHPGLSRLMASARAAREA